MFVDSICQTSPQQKVHPNTLQTDNAHKMSNQVRLESEKSDAEGYLYRL